MNDSVIEIHELLKIHVRQVANLFNELWKDSNIEEESKFLEKTVHSDQHQVYLAKTNNEIIGFIFLSIRTEYVEGSSISPVGYIEGIYVREKLRKKGIGQQLYEKAKLWLQSKGIKEIGSDTEIDNQTSILFHKKLGFEEASQNIHFIKQI